MVDLNDYAKILVTGGTGHLGSNIVRYLVERRGIPPRKIRIFYLKGTPIDSVADIPDLELFPGNILNKRDVSAAVEGIEIIFHTVGNTSFNPRLKKLQWMVNVEGTRNILEAARRSESVRRVVHTSTVNTLGVPDPPGSLGTLSTADPYKSHPRIHSFSSAEETLRFIRGVRNGTVQKWWKKIRIGYFDSKLAVQELVLFYCKEYDLDAVCVLPGTMFGAYDMFVGAGIYIISIYNGKLPGALPGGCPCMHVRDSVRGHILASERGKKGEKYIVTGREEDCLYYIDIFRTIADVIKKYEKGWTKKVPTRIFGRKTAMLGAYLSIFLGKLFKRSVLLSPEAVIAGCLPLFYTYRETEEKIGYTPRESFVNAVAEHFTYFKNHGMLSIYK